MTFSFSCQSSPSHYSREGEGSWRHEEIENDQIAQVVSLNWWWLSWMILKIYVLRIIFLDDFVLHVFGIGILNTIHNDFHFYFRWTGILNTIQIISLSLSAIEQTLWQLKYRKRGDEATLATWSTLARATSTSLLPFHPGENNHSIQSIKLCIFNICEVTQLLYLPSCICKLNILLLSSQEKCHPSWR